MAGKTMVAPSGDTEHTEGSYGLQAGAGDLLEGAKHVADVAGKTAVAAALAGTIAAGANAVTPDQIHLPDPTPIVQMADQGADQPDSVVDDQDQQKSSAVKRLLQILKYALLALLFIAAIVFGVLRGCASCAAGIPAASDTSSSDAVASEAPSSSNR